jgi:predicted DCC family thiol-disulfide oxidoreductase YuxK
MRGQGSWVEGGKADSGPTAALLLYDGRCGFCAASVAFMLRHERQHTLRFATLEGAIGSEIRRRHPELEASDSVVWVDPPAEGHAEQVFVRSVAALRAARYLGGPWHLLAVGHLLPRGIRDWIYDWIARHRHSLSAGGRQCFVPSPDQASRFLDREAATINAPGLVVPPGASLEDPGGHQRP